MNSLLSFALAAIVSLAPVQDRGASAILVPGKSWELLGQGYQLTADSAVDKDGTIYFSDARKNRILKVDLHGRVTVWKENSNSTHGVGFGPDGRLYGGQHDSEGFLCVATNTGVQVCDSQGRVTSNIGTPGSEGIAAVFFGGQGLQWLYVIDGDKLYRRPVKRRGAF